MAKIIKNLHGTDNKTYAGMIIAAGQSYTIQESELSRFKLSSNLIEDLVKTTPEASLRSDQDATEMTGTDAVSFLLGQDDMFDIDGHKIVSTRKSYKESSKSFTTPDYTNRNTWFGDYTRVTDEVMTTADDTIYDSARTPTATWNHHWIEWSEIPNHIRQSDPTNMKIVVKKNDVAITTGFTIDNTNGQITFDSANSGSDVIKVSYAYANSSAFCLMANAGKVLNLDYVEVQFSVGSALPTDEVMLFESIYNGPAMPTYGIPADTDVVLKTFEYHGYRDFLNESTQAITCEAFMGMTKKAIILPWNYLTGHSIVPVGEVADLAVNQFHKLRCRMKGNGVITNSEIATGTFYCIIGSY